MSLEHRWTNDSRPPHTAESSTTRTPDAEPRTRDGRAWRGNGANVDINRNFAAGWGNDERSSADERSWNFRGEEAGGEAETRVVDAVMGCGGYHLVIDVHSAGERVIGYIPGRPGGTQEEEAEADLPLETLPQP